jgi:hypothetical protein
MPETAERAIERGVGTLAAGLHLLCQRKGAEAAIRNIDIIQRVLREMRLEFLKQMTDDH